MVPAPTSPGLRTICSCRCHRMVRAPCLRRRMRRLRHPMHRPRHPMHRPLWSMHRLPQYPLRRPSGRRRLVTLELRTHSKPNCACADVSSIFSATRLRRSLQAPRKSDAVPVPSRLWATSLCSVNANPALDVWPYLLGRMTWGKFLGRMSKQTLLELRLKNVTPVTRVRLHAHDARGNSRSGNRDREYVLVEALRANDASSVHVNSDHLKGRCRSRARR